jgi:NCS2 family nucleobase:cation symporter-2
MIVDVKSTAKRVLRKWTTRDGLLGDYDYKYLFTPDIPFLTKEPKTQPFFGLDSEMPILLGAILGFQHSLAMLAGVVTVPIMIASAANLSVELEQYLVSTALIVSGVLSLVQISRFHIPKTGYYLGTGLLSVVGTSFATITIVTKALPIMYLDGTCPVDADGTHLPCPDGYGKILASGCVCALLEILLSFMNPKMLQKIFPPLVTGPVVLLIGVHLVESGFKDWVGGSGCVGDTCTYGNFTEQWGDAKFIGLGFVVFVSIVLAERFGAPIMKSCAVIFGLLIGCIVASAAGYFSSDNVDIAPAASFIWVHTFKLEVYGPIILPFLAVYIVLMMECIGDVTATSDVSRLPVSGEEYESRIQGGVLADGLGGILSTLMTITPMSVFAQNNGVISITKCANRIVGYWCCFFMIVMGIFAKFAGAITSIPKPVLGGMTSFLFALVAISGVKIISTTEFTRRDRFVLTAAILPGLGATLVPTWFDYVFTYDGGNRSLKGFFNAIVLVMETGYAVTGFLGVILNLAIPQVQDDVEEINEIVLETVGSADQHAREEFERKEGVNLETLRSQLSNNNQNGRGKNMANLTVTSSSDGIPDLK